MPDASRGNSAVDAADIVGGTELTGTVRTTGFKHSLVTCVAAACLGAAPVHIANIPDIAETEFLGRLLRGIGAGVSFEAYGMTIDPATMATAELDPADVGAIHGSVYLAPALLARFGSVQMPSSGGCQIGSEGGARPVNQYIDVLGRFGAKARYTDCGFAATATGLRAAEIDLLDYTEDPGRRTGPLYSGATKFAILLAVAAPGISVLHNPYPKLDVHDMVSLLTEMGARIEYSSDATLVVHGGIDRLHAPVTFALSADLIEVMTWLSAGLAYSDAGITITGEGMRRALEGLAPELAALSAMGGSIAVTGDSVVVRKTERLRAHDIVIESHGVFSDSQPFFVLAACLADGISRITETVWPARCGYISELIRLGPRIQQSGQTIFVEGGYPPRIPGQHLHADDLRAAAALVLAALNVPGHTRVYGTHHLRRGYADLTGQLRSLGADVRAAPQQWPAPPE